jgi:hypothetical protein
MAEFASLLLPAEEFNARYAKHRINKLRAGIVRIDAYLKEVDFFKPIVMTVDTIDSSFYKDLLESKGFQCTITNCTKSDPAGMVRLNIVTPSDADLFKKFAAVKDIPNPDTKDDSKQDTKDIPKKDDPKKDTKDDTKKDDSKKDDTKKDTKDDPKKDDTKKDTKDDSKQDTKDDPKQVTKDDPKQVTKDDPKQVTKDDPKKDTKDVTKQNFDQEELDNVYKVITEHLENYDVCASSVRVSISDALFERLHSQGYGYVVTNPTCDGLVNFTVIVGKIRKAFAKIKNSLKQANVCVTDVSDNISVALCALLKQENFICEVGKVADNKDNKDNKVTITVTKKHTKSVGKHTDSIVRYFINHPTASYEIFSIELDIINIVASHLTKKGYKCELEQISGNFQILCVKRAGTNASIRAEAVFRQIKKYLDDNKLAINVVIDTDIEDAIVERLKSENCKYYNTRREYKHARLMIEPSSGDTFTKIHNVQFTTEITGDKIRVNQIVEFPVVEFDK